MKGIIFTEFIEMVEDKFGFVVSEKIISNADLPSGGSYTAVGTYDFDEMLQLVNNLSNETKIALPDLLFTFGEHLFGCFYGVYPHFFVGKSDAFGFLSNIDDYIHVEVLKLYPDAELPHIQTELSADGKTMKMVYKSSRKMSDLAIGLLEGCKKHFNEDFRVEKEEVKNDGGEVTFLLIKN